MASQYIEINWIICFQCGCVCVAYEDALAAVEAVDVGLAVGAVFGDVGLAVEGVAEINNNLYEFFVFEI